MKKIIIAVAFTCSAIIAHAATANWSFNAANIYNGTGSTATSDKYSGTAYLFDAGITSQAALYALVAGGTDLSSSISGYVKTATVSSGTIAATTFSYGEQSVSSTDKNYYTYYFAILSDDQIYFSQEKSIAANATATTAAVAFANQNASASGTYSSLAPTGTGYEGAGKWSAVPEPTSGLLMLLGMAGLALRRRRA